LNIPDVTRAWGWRQYGEWSGLSLEQRPLSPPGPGEILMRVHANSINQRDVMVGRGKPPLTGLPAGLIPLCDGAGEIVAIGPGVDSRHVGQRVLALIYKDWDAGPLMPTTGRSTLGGPLDGMLREHVVLPARCVVPIPDGLSFEQAATLPCAALTAWNALFGKSGLQAGESVLTMGSGGVSLFALQMAKAAGARVYMTTSDEARAERLIALGADGVVNYRRHAEDWPQRVHELSGGGVDVIVENGGGATFVQAMGAAAMNGRLAIVGLITGMQDSGGALVGILMRNLTVRAVTVGNRVDMEALLRLIEVNRIAPIIDSVIDFESAPEAYARIDSGQAFGKVVIRHRA